MQQTDLFNEQQLAAVTSFKEFMEDENKTLFALLGSAGTGKSYTASHLYGIIRPSEHKWFDIEEMFWLAPTWKAARIAGNFLDRLGADYEITFNAFAHTQGRMILTTTQQALGIRPIISDNQTATNMEFGESGNSLVPKLKPRVIVIDEVSMLSASQLEKLYNQAKVYGCKILIIGDNKQLPPVNAKEIRWDNLQNVHRLTQIMRQSSDSAIPHLGAAISAGEDWRAVRGNGLVQVRNAAAEFLGHVGVPAVLEDERDVFVAYRNQVVNEVQERAAQKVYGHSAKAFAPGEVVIAQSALHAKSKGMLVANQDQLTVLEVGGAGEWGRQVRVRNHAGRSVETEYLSGEELANAAHPYRITLDVLHREAVAKQADWLAKGKDPYVDAQRRSAWNAYFKHKDQTVLSFSHPFAITSHKSQGSSYRNVYMAATDIEQFDKRGLYVAATRPKEELIY